MRQVRGMGVVVVAISLTLLAGCGGLTGPAPEQPDQQAELAILSSGDVGAVGCSILASELKPAELAQAQAATVAAMSVLNDPVPTISDLSAALSAPNLDPRYTALSAVIVQRIKVRLGGADLLPTDSTGWAMAEAFIESCQGSLVALPSA